MILRVRTVALPVLGLALALAACGKSTTGSTNGSGASPSASSNSLAALVPADIKAKGKLVVAEDASYPPNEFFDKDGKTVIGMDADLANAIAAKLGLTADVQNAGFDGILAGIDSAKYDLGMSSFTDTKDREKTVDFVTYFSAGTSFYAKAGSTLSPQSLDDICGLTIAVEKGTTQGDDANGQSPKCTAAGKKKVSVSTFPDQNGANLALTSGRAVLGMADSPVAAYIVQQSGGTLAVVGQPYGVAPYGIAVKKGSGLVQAVKAALDAMIADGSYTQLLTKWGVQAGAVTATAINGAIS
jgi:polar amino acid transport system substrate-binding protein